jgi:hypothetical protein
MNKAPTFTLRNMAGLVGFSGTNLLHAEAKPVRTERGILFAKRQVRAIIVALDDYSSMGDATGLSVW